MESRFRTMSPKALRNRTLESEQRYRTIRKATSVPAPETTTQAAAPHTLIKAVNECRRQIKSAQRQIAILIERNIGLQKTLSEITQREAKIRYLAYHDELTGLPNRSLLLDRFGQAMAQAQRNRKPIALLLLDLNEFKRVNDTLGHTSGDKLLQAVALRLSKVIRGADTACRYGGDEFVIMLPEADNTAFANALIMEIQRRLNEPYIIDRYTIQLGVSVGIAIYPRDGQTLYDLMQQADVAMYQNKDSGNAISIIEQPEQYVDGNGSPNIDNYHHALEHDLSTTKWIDTQT